MRAELARRGADKSVIEPAVSGALDADDREAALETARRLLGKGSCKPDRLARQLDRKGFSRRAILHALRELGPDLEVPAES